MRDDLLCGLALATPSDRLDNLLQLLDSHRCRQPLAPRLALHYQLRRQPLATGHWLQGHPLTSTDRLLLEKLQLSLHLQLLQLLRTSRDWSSSPTHRLQLTRGEVDTSQ
jgi:hypothetical protein